MTKSDALDIRSGIVQIQKQHFGGTQHSYSVEPIAEQTHCVRKFSAFQKGTADQDTEVRQATSWKEVGEVASKKYTVLAFMRSAYFQ